MPLVCAGGICSLCHKPKRENLCNLAVRLLAPRGEHVMIAAVGKRHGGIVPLILPNHDQ